METTTGPPRRYGGIFLQLTWTWRQSASAKEYTATVCRPSSLQARMTLTAISPLLATRTLLKAVVDAHKALPDRL